MHDLPQNAPDLASCASEPIHIPGAIQPHGALLTLSAEGRLLQASANLREFLGTAECDLRALQPLVRRVLDEPSLLSQERLLMQGRWLLALAHASDGLAVVELEQDGAQHTVDGAEALHRIASAGGLAELVSITASAMRELTGFDRVMVYRFDDDDHGEVVAESVEPGMEPYLGLHYPESDIPRQARALYLKNWIRCIPDARYVPVPVLPASRPDNGQPLDLGKAWLRSVSPVHLEYLANMGVQASMSVSLIVDGRLWGLISCGHRTPRAMPMAQRRACETVGRLVSSQLAALAASEFRLRELSGRPDLLALRQAMEHCDGPLLRGLLSQPAALLRLVEAEGAAVVLPDAVLTAGSCPADEDIEAVAHWGRGVAQEGCFATRQLPLDVPAWDCLAPQASGVLGFTVPGEGAACVLWFRPEQVQAVHWGGDPAKAARVEPGARLRPRASFERWRQVVRGRATAWHPAQIQLAGDLRRHAVEVDLARQLLAQKAAVQARDDLVAVVSHDLRTPVSIVAMQAALMQRIVAQAGAEAAGRLLASVQTVQRSAERMTTLLRDLLDLAKIEAGRFEVHPVQHTAVQLVEEARDLMQHPAEAKGLRLLAAPTPDVPVLADSERIFQVFANLIGNAVKFTPEGGRIQVGARTVDGFCEFYVSDTGAGMSGEQQRHVFDRYWRGKVPGEHGAGLGLYICRGIVEAHGGTIRVLSQPQQGSTFLFTVPLASA